MLEINFNELISLEIEFTNNEDYMYLNLELKKVWEDDVFLGFIMKMKLFLILGIEII